MARYIVVRYDSKRNLVVLGNSDDRDNARSIMKQDFEQMLRKRYWYVIYENTNLEKFYLNHKDNKLQDDIAMMSKYDEVDYNWMVINTTTDDILSEPLSLQKIVLMTSDDNTYVRGNILVDLSEIIDNDLEGFLDLISERLVNNVCLMDVQYKVIDTLNDGRLVVSVSGDASEILSYIFDFYDGHEMIEELKSALFMNGIEALEEFTDMDLSRYDDKDTLDNILDEVLAQMSKDDIIKYCRKYLS